MKKKIIWKFLCVYALVILVTVFILNFFVGLKLRDYYELKISERLKSNAYLVGDILRDDILLRNESAIQKKTQNLADKLGLRISIIDDKGKILGDSDRDPKLMDSHNDRLEILRAIEEGVGESNRFSETLNYSMKYVALALKDKGDIFAVVRLAVPLVEVESQIRVIYRIVLTAGCIAIIFAIFFGYIAFRAMVTPLNEIRDVAQNIEKGLFDKRVKIRGRDELSEVAGSINKMADKLESTIANLKKADKLKSDLVANVSHELKTPLTSIKGFIETLEDGALEDKENALRFISIIKKRAIGLENIIEDLLTLSVLESETSRLELEKINMRDLIEELVLGFGHSISKKNLKIKTRFSGDDFDFVGDKMKVEQVLINIIDNAVKYSTAGGNIDIHVHSKEDSLCVTIKDNAIGISREHLGRVFERFYRVDKSRSRDAGGTGLGLAIVKHIMNIHKGKVDIESQPNFGTKLILTFPRS